MGSKYRIFNVAKKIANLTVNKHLQRTDFTFINEKKNWKVIDSTWEYAQKLLTKKRKKLRFIFEGVFNIKYRIKVIIIIIFYYLF